MRAHIYVCMRVSVSVYQTLVGLPDCLPDSVVKVVSRKLNFDKHNESKSKEQTE